MELKGKKYLKIVGILMIVFGALGAVVYAMGMFAGGVLLAASTGEGSSIGEAVSGIMMVVLGVGLVWSIAELVVGIYGIKNCDKQENAKTCFTLGIVLLVFSLVYSFGGMMVQGFTVSGICGLIIGLILPGLYCYGAKLNQE